MSLFLEQPREIFAQRLHHGMNLPRCHRQILQVVDHPPIADLDRAIIRPARGRCAGDGPVEAVPGPRRTADLEKNPVIAQLRDRVVDAGLFTGRRIDDSWQKTDAWMKVVAQALRDNHAYILELTGSEEASPLGRDFSQIWFTGLSPVTAAAVTVLRYVQAEQQIREFIEEIVPFEGVRLVPRCGTALPALRKTDLKRGSIERAKALLAGYRDAILNDRDNTGAEASGGAGEQAIGKAIQFLETLGERRVEDHHGEPGSARRSYYLLDVIPEHRLSL